MHRYQYVTWTLMQLLAILTQYRNEIFLKDVTHIQKILILKTVHNIIQISYQRIFDKNLTPRCDYNHNIFLSF